MTMVRVTMTLFRVDPVCFYMVHVLAWFMCDWVLIHIVQVCVPVSQHSVTVYQPPYSHISTHTNTTIAQLQIMTFTFTFSNACLQNGNLPFNKFEFLVMWLFRECGAPYLFLHAILNPDVSWRSQRFRSAQSFSLQLYISTFKTTITIITSNKQNVSVFLQSGCCRLKWGGEVEPVLVPRTKADIVKEPSSVKFSSPEEITPLPQHVKRHSRHNSLQLRHEILKMEKDVISD